MRAAFVHPASLGRADDRVFCSSSGLIGAVISWIMKLDDVLNAHLMFVSSKGQLISSFELAHRLEAPGLSARHGRARHASRARRCASASPAASIRRRANSSISATIRSLSIR